MRKPKKLGARSTESADQSVLFPLSSAEALAYLIAWTSTAHTETSRLLDPALGSSAAALASRQLEAPLFVFALRQVLRAAELVQRCATPAQAASIDEALDTFRADVPALVHMRDVLEHFDDYATGEGKLQKTLSRPLVPANHFLEWDGATVKIYLGIRESGSWVIDVSQAGAALERLGDSVADALSRPADAAR
jgi:hypothetical protein